MVTRCTNLNESPNDMRTLDRTDRLILKALQVNGRKSFAQLARDVNLTTSPCLDRVRRLEEDGYIQGYVALLNPAHLGVRLLAFVGVRTDRTTPEVFEGFRIAVESMDEVIECHMVAGGFDYLIKIRVPDMEHYRRFLGERLAKLPGILHIHTYVAMEEVKSNFAFKF